mgnify:CR=1 FL=1
MRQHYGKKSINLNPKSVAQFLGIVALVLVLASIATQFAFIINTL